MTSPAIAAVPSSVRMQASLRRFWAMAQQPAGFPLVDYAGGHVCDGGHSPLRTG